MLRQVGKEETGTKEEQSDLQMIMAVIQWVPLSASEWKRNVKLCKACFLPPQVILSSSQKKAWEKRIPDLQ